MNRRVRCRIGHAWPFLIAPLLLAAPSLVEPAHADPDFSDVDDVLLGRRLVLPVQDVVMSLAGDYQNTISQTDQGVLSGQTPYATQGTVLSTASGRVFDLENDVIVTMVRTGSEAAALNIRDPLGDRTLQIPLPFGICPTSEDCNPSLVALGDLSGDGYDEIVIGYAGGGLQVASATDVSDFTRELVFGELYQGTQIVPVPTPQALAVGDLNGDGQGEIAAVDLPQFEIYELVTPAGSDDPSLDIERASFAAFEPTGAGTADYALQIGQFDADATDRELVIGYNGPDTGGVQLVLVEVGADLAPTVSDPQDQGGTAQGFALAAGRLDWFGDTDQLAVAIDQGGGDLTLFVSVAIDGFFAPPAGAIKLSTGAAFCSPPSLGGLTLGDFDFDVEKPDSTPPDLEIAVLVSCVLGKSEVQLFQVDPTKDFAPSLETTTQVVQSAFPQVAAGLVASDTQGRSLLLGPPDKVTINQHSQPRIVMGAPPMHIDYVQDPANSSSTFGQVNMSAFPATDEASARGMNSEFDLASTSKIDTQTQHATSYNYSVTTGVSVSVGISDPDIGSLSASMKSTATTTHAGLVQNKFGAYSSFAFDISTITGFGDVVWYDTNRFNLWIYRVLGHFACPADDPDCDATLPLYLTFSGPDQIVNHPHTPGPAVEWYQPYHEVGNILSYPQNLTQLGEALSNELDQFFELEFTTGSNDDTETLTWTQGQSNAQTSGSVTTHSRSETESISGSSFFGGEGGSFSESNSTSVSTLNTTVQTMAASDGFQVSVPGFNLGDAYSYPFDGFLLGDPADPDVLQQELINDLANQVDQPVNGTLRLAFTTQPDNAAGTWWSNETAPYLSAPDVALNHPTRWSLLSETSGPLSSVYCFNVLDRDDVQKGGGYEIKGLFVLPEGATSGPQITLADEGDTLQLQARVYNYSRLDMDQATPPVAQVQAQFYGQQWDTSTQEFTGDAFLIDQVKLDPIAGNNSNNQGLNSALATTEFDTGSCPLQGGCGGKYLKFWLVVWMEDANGNLVADYQDHGLVQSPTAPLSSMGQVNIEPISNNVGFFDQEIYVCPEGAQCAAPGLPGAATLDQVTLSRAAAASFETVEVSARLRAGERPVGPVLVLFYDGDPAQGGDAFEVEHVPFIEPNASYLTKVRFQPRTAGTHDVFVVAQGGGRAVSGTTRLEVAEADPAAASTCQSPLTVAQRLSGSLSLAGEHADGALRLQAVLRYDEPLVLDAARVGLERFAHELGGAGELIKDAAGEDLGPLELSARPGARPWRAWYETAADAPFVWLRLQRLPGHRLALDLRVRRIAEMDMPQLCRGERPTTSLMTRLVLDDGERPALTLPITASWDCVADADGNLRRLRVRPGRR